MVTLVTWTFLLSSSCNLRVNSHPRDPLLKTGISLPSLCPSPVNQMWLPSAYSHLTFWKPNLDHFFWKLRSGSLGGIATGQKSGISGQVPRYGTLTAEWESTLDTLWGILRHGPCLHVFSYISYKLKLWLPLLSVILDWLYVLRCVMIFFPIPSSVLWMATAALDLNMPFPSLMG